MASSAPQDATRTPVPSGLWPGSSPELIAAHERAMALVAEEDGVVVGIGSARKCIATFVVVLMLACLGLNSVFDALPGIRLDEGSVARRKYEYFAANKDSFNAVFVGSSQVYRHIDPELFDSLLDGSGQPVHSFNFGIGGMYFPEVLHAVDWILEQRPKNLKWLFVELRELEPLLFDENQVSLRDINWHTPRVAGLMAALTWRADEPWLDRLDTLHWTLRRSLHRFGNVALAIPAIELLLMRWEDSELDSWARRGHLTMDDELRENPGDPGLTRRRAFFRNNPQAHARLMAEYADDAQRLEPSPLLVDTLATLTLAIRAAGVEPVYFISAPSYRRYADIKRARELDVIPNLFSYNDPDAHPGFYARDELFEMRHLMSRGAERFTRLLARDFAAFREAREGD